MMYSQFSTIGNIAIDKRGDQFVNAVEVGLPRVVDALAVMKGSVLGGVVAVA